MNADARLKFIQEALLAHNGGDQPPAAAPPVIPWASRSDITVHPRADNFVTPYWVKMQ